MLNHLNLVSQQFCRRANIKHDASQLEYKLAFKVVHHSWYLLLLNAAGSGCGLFLQGDTTLQAPKERKRKPVVKEELESEEAITGSNFSTSSAGKLHRER